MDDWDYFATDFNEILVSSNDPQSDSSSSGMQNIENADPAGAHESSPKDGSENTEPGEDSHNIMAAIRSSVCEHLVIISEINASQQLCCLSF